VLVSLDAQSPDIAQGVDAAYEFRTGSGGEDTLNAQGAGDQGMMFGYACDETPDLMPLPIWLTHRLSERLSQVRRIGAIPYLRPDGKTQVSVVYEGGRPVRIDTVLISTQHAPGIDLEEQLLNDLTEHVINPLLPTDLDTENVRILANPTGIFELGGPHADTGLTSRARTRPRSTAPRLTPPAGWPSTSWHPARRRAAKCRWPTPSGWPTPYR
jgi:S-adenosylmethionine synthetase